MVKDTSQRIRISFAIVALAAIGTTAWTAPLPAEQTAIVQRGYGGPEVLKVETIPVREPGEGQVLVQIYATGVNPVDWKMREGINGRPPGAPDTPRPPAPAMRIPGSDAAGVIAKVGPGVTDLKVGEPVAGTMGGGITGLNGAYAHYALAAADHVVPKPKNMTYAEAAGLGTGGNTAGLAIYRLKVQAGQTVLITGVAGGVGSSMAQLAKAKGAHVIGTASARHTKYLKSIGVDEVVDYTQGDWSAKVKNVDIVFDTVGGPTAQQAAGTLKKGGLFLGIATENGELSNDQCASAGVTCVPLRPPQPGDPSEQVLLSGTAKLAAAGKFKMHVDKTFPLEQAGDAQELSRQGHTEGKIILVANPAKASTR
jgi:NADPH:quinone reductase-like Zn-dependent oxidoreductase